MIVRVHHRSGITLTEALVAMFVAALGMISLLTLFPLGALQMGQALKDGRCAQCAQTGDNMFRWYSNKYNLTHPNHPVWLALDRGNYPNTAPGGSTPNHPAWVSAGDRNVSYPVVIDPQGWSTLTSWALGNSTNNAVLNQNNLPRRTIYQGSVAGGTTVFNPLVTAERDILRYTMLQDDMTFSDSRTGAPDSTVQRSGRYNTIWVLQRPENSRRNVIGMTVVVFDQRAPFYATAETERQFKSNSTLNTNKFAVPGSTTIELDFQNATPNTRPTISKGRWIADITLGTNASGVETAPGATGYIGLRHYNFYRVASVNDESPGKLTIELETPIRRNDGGTGQYHATWLLMTGVTEVFERPPLVLE
jgi:Tfp pilus assembly protein PilV